MHPSYSRCLQWRQQRYRLSGSRRATSRYLPSRSNSELSPVKRPLSKFFVCSFLLAFLCLPQDKAAMGTFYLHHLRGLGIKTLSKIAQLANAERRHHPQVSAARLG